ncbi:MAG: flagellar biosynthesis protein FlgN [Pseudooceanicola sp.]
MQNYDADGILDALDDLLNRERDALLSGQLDRLPDLLEDKERLIERLGRTEMAEESQLAALRRRAERNQALLDNAMRGIRAVAERLGTMRRLRQSLDTYDPSGRRTSIVTRPGRVERRA